ncbi:hypothetical protein AB8Q18_09405 [Neisseriaceae bacterium CLB008]
MSDSAWVYIMVNKQQSIMHISCCVDLWDQVTQHKALTGTPLHASHQTVFLVYFEPQENLLVAEQRAKKIRRWPRNWRLALIERENPEWLDLYAGLSNEPA